MSSTLEKPPELPPIDAAKAKARKTYCKPELTDLGDLRTFTLGSSGHSIDSQPGPGTEFTLP